MILFSTCGEYTYLFIGTGYLYVRCECGYFDSFRAGDRFQKNRCILSIHQRYKCACVIDPSDKHWPKFTEMIYDISLRPRFRERYMKYMFSVWFCYLL